MTNSQPIGFTIIHPAPRPSEQVLGEEGGINLLIREDGSDKNLLSLFARAVRSALAPSLPPAIRRRMITSSFDPRVELENAKPVLEIQLPTDAIGGDKGKKSGARQKKTAPLSLSSSSNAPVPTILSELRLALPLARILLPRVQLRCPNGCGLLAESSPSSVIEKISAEGVKGRARVLLGLRYELTPRISPGASSPAGAPEPSRYDPIEAALILIESYRSRGARRYSFNGRLFAIDPSAELSSSLTQHPRE